MVAEYIPDAGDIIWINFDPQVGREQAGHRPALVLSPKRYNQYASLLIACPITTKIKGYPFEARIIVGKIDGIVLADQIKSLDWRQRKITKGGKASKAVSFEVASLVCKLIEQQN